MKSGNLNFLEYSWLLQACNGTALSFLLQNQDSWESGQFVWNCYMCTHTHTQQNCKFSDYHNSCCSNYMLSCGLYTMWCALFLLKFWRNKLSASSGWLNWSRWLLNRCAERRCVSYIVMFEALWSNTATGRSVTSHIPKKQVFSDVTPSQWISGSWHSEGSMGPSSSGSGNNAEKPQISQILTPTPQSVSVIGQIPTTFLYNWHALYHNISSASIWTNSVTSEDADSIFLCNTWQNKANTWCKNQDDDHSLNDTTNMQNSML
jgi:hypothetical protein